MENIYRKPLNLSLVSMQREEFNLKNEIRMLKTALIYGDTVDIYSIASSIIMPYLAAGAQSREEVHKNFPKDLAEDIIKSSNEYVELEGVREFLAIMSEHFDIIQLHTFRGAERDIKLNLEQYMILDFMEMFSNDYFSRNTIPFFDEMAGYFAKTVTEFDKTIPQRLSTEQSKQIAIVSDLISRLPLFEKASVDEIFDIRKELKKPLVPQQVKDVG